MHTNNDARRKRLLGDRVRWYRERAKLSQGDVADEVGVTRDYISSIEIGRIGVVYPTVFNGLQRTLGFPGWEMLELMGYHTNATTLDTQGIYPPLLSFISKMDKEQQRATYEALRAMVKIDGHGVRTG
jgi:transcriptional regulator with XRE-family HTH domain